MPYVLRQIHAPGKSALADEATAAALARAAIEGNIQYGVYLEWSDPDAKDGMGDERWTNDVNKAKKFLTFKAAIEGWKEQSKTHPFRDDGKPNRPLTAWSVTPERV